MRAPRTVIFGVLACVVAAVIAACVGDDPTYAGPTTQDGSTPDANNVAPATDASGPVTDGATPTSDAASDAGPARFCATQAMPPDASDFFCADFDGTNFEEGFQDASVTDGGGVLTQDNNLFLSKPNSAHTEIASIPAADSYLYWHRGGPMTVNQISLSAAIKEDFVETAGAPNGIIGLLTLNVGTGDFEYTVAFVYAFGQTDADTNQTFTGYALMILTPVGTASFYGTGILSQTGDFANVTLKYDGTNHAAEVLYGTSSVQHPNYESLSGNLAVEALVGGKSVNIGTDELQGKWNIDNVVFSASP